MRYPTPVFKHNKRCHFLRVGLCPTRFLPFAGDVAAQRTSDAHALIGMRRCGGHGVHAITNYSRCRKNRGLNGSPADAWTEMARSIVIECSITIGRAISIRWP